LITDPEKCLPANNPLLKPNKTIVSRNGTVSPGKCNTTFLTIITLLTFLGTPFYDLRRATNPTFFLLINIKLKTVSILIIETVHWYDFEVYFTNYFLLLYHFFHDFHYMTHFSILCIFIVVFTFPYYLYSRKRHAPFAGLTASHQVPMPIIPGNKSISADKFHYD
jgi:hypothetical protein